MYLARLEGDEGAERVAFSMLISGSAVPMRMGNVPAGLVWIFTLGISSRAERDVCENLGRRGPGEQDRALVLGRRLLPGESHVLVLVLEELVQTAILTTLERVADDGGPEAVQRPLLPSAAMMVPNRGQTNCVRPGLPVELMLVRELRYVP